MHNTFRLLMLLGFPLLTLSASAQSVSTVPQGMMTYTLNKGINYLSFPLTAQPVYSGAVSTLTANSISVSSSPFVPGALNAPTVLSPNLSVPSFVRFLSGAELGRVVLVTTNTANTLVLDTTDHTSLTTPLNQSGFSVLAGDTFEVLQGETLETEFGDGSSNNPLLLTGASVLSKADTIGLFTTLAVPPQVYYFNTTANQWELANSGANANNTIIYPFSAIGIQNRGLNPNGIVETFALVGQVPAYSLLNRTLPNTTSYLSTQYPVDLTLDSLSGTPSTKLVGYFSGGNDGHTTGSASVTLTDTVGIYNPSNFIFETYYLDNNNVWQKSLGTGTAVNPNPVSDHSGWGGTILPAGSVITLLNRQTTTGVPNNFYLQIPLPYTLTP